MSELGRSEIVPKVPLIGEAVAVGLNTARQPDGRSGSSMIYDGKIIDNRINKQTS